MRKFALIIVLIVSSQICKSQNLVSNSADDSLNYYINQYNITKFFHYKYEDQSYFAIEKASERVKTALSCIDSAKAILDTIPYIRSNKKISSLNNAAHQLYDSALVSYRIADSLKYVALKYTDSSNVEKKKAETFLVQLETINNSYLINDSTKKNQPIQTDSLLVSLAINSPSLITPEQMALLSKLSQPSTFVVQIGAGDMNLKYFSKVKDMEIYIGDDGIKRYTVGKFITKDDASELKQKMIDLGFKDCFIRRIDPETLKPYNK